jgi:5-methyltetrahydrofolate--homocysteine methyltransferase
MTRMTALARLADQTPDVVFDGAMGTMLQDAGLEAGVASESWNLDNPEAVKAIHRAYLEAGARVVTTNTFGGSRPRLELQGLGDRVEEINAAGARVAREAAEEFGALVAGDIGPTGELLEPMGILTPEEAEGFFAEQVRGLVAGGIDLLLVETMSDLAEVTAAVRAAQSVAPDVPVVVTLSFDTHLRTMMGVTPSQAVHELAPLGVSAIGANCGRGPEEMEQVMAQMVAVRPEGLLLLAQSNAGLPQLVGDHFEYDAAPERMADHAQRLRDLGVDLIGACCGSTPEHVRAMHDALRTA